MKLAQTVCLNLILNEFENGHARSKAGSLGQILERKICLCSTGYIFCSIFFKFRQNVCFSNFLHNLENGSYQMKNYVSSRVLLRNQIHWDKWPTEFEKGGPFQKIWGPSGLPIYDANGLSAFRQVAKTYELLNNSQCVHSNTITNNKLFYYSF